VYDLVLKPVNQDMDKMDFRFDIAFLRGMAIIAVVLYHLHLPYFKNGYLGVDIFFVISGYLMCNILSKKGKIGRSEILEFYIRRARRLIPALLLMLTIVFLLVVLFLPSKIYDHSRFSIVSILQVSNMYYYLVDDYFQPSSRLNFLLHTWTLSLEWQFYALLPWIYFLLYRFFPSALHRRRVSFMALLTLASFLIYIIFSEIDASLAFYSLPSRAWEFLAGGTAMAVADRARPIRSWPGPRSIGILLTLVLLFLLLCPIEWSNLPYGRPLATFLTVIATSIILTLNLHFSFFRFGPVIWTSSISYSLYLWHWPLFVLGRFLGSGTTWWIIPLLLLMAIFIAQISYAQLESRRDSINWKPVLCVIILLSSLSVLGTTDSIRKSIFPDQKDNITRSIQEYPRRTAPIQYGFGQGHLRSKEDFFPEQVLSGLKFSDSLPNILLLGDCYAAMFSTSLREIARSEGVNLLQATCDHTFPAPHSTSPFSGPAKKMSFLFRQLIPLNATRIDMVIIGANYSGYTKRQILEYLSSTEEFFKDHGIPVKYIGQTEGYSIEFPIIQDLHERFGMAHERFLENKRKIVNEFLRNSQISDRYIDVYLKASSMERLPRNSLMYMYDSEHLSLVGTDNLSGILRRNIFAERP